MGVWAGRFYAAIYGFSTLFPLLRRGGPDWVAAAILIAFAVGLWLTTERMRRGSRVAASALLSLVAAERLRAWGVEGQPMWYGLLWTVITGGALANATWGTFVLATVCRDAAHVPPAPPRASGRPVSGR